MQSVLFSNSCTYQSVSFLIIHSIQSIPSLFHFLFIKRSSYIFFHLQLQLILWNVHKDKLVPVSTNNNNNIANSQSLTGLFPFFHDLKEQKNAKFWVLKSFLCQKIKKSYSFINIKSTSPYRKYHYISKYMFFKSVDVEYLWCKLLVWFELQLPILSKLKTCFKKLTNIFWPILIYNSIVVIFYVN